MYLYLISPWIVKLKLCTYKIIKRMNEHIKILNWFKRKMKAETERINT